MRFLSIIFSILFISCGQNKKSDIQQVSEAKRDSTQVLSKTYSGINKNINLSDTLKTDSIIESDKNEKKIYEIILALPEVKERANYIERHTKGARHLRVWIYQTPNETGEKYYWVKAGEDNGTNFVSHFNFFVYPDNFEIKYYDTVNDTIINLETWRKEMKNGR